MSIRRPGEGGGGEGGRSGGLSPAPRGARGALALALLAMVAAAPLAARAQFVDPDPNVLPSGQGPLYASAAQIYTAMDRWAAANPRYFSVHRARDPVTGQSFPVGRFTDSQAPASASARKKRVLLTCTVHARELIVAEVCLNLLRLLAGTPQDRRPVVAWPETAAALRKAGLVTRAETPAGGGSLTGAPRDPLASVAAAFAREYDLHVAPLINLSGRMLIEKEGKYGQRKTGESPQTDINRNFYYAWSDANKDLGSETYPGAYPASQWETRAMVALMTSVDPHAYADVHSGVAAYLTPQGTTCSQLEVDPLGLPPLQDAADRILRVVGNITNGPSAALLYTALGTGGDHAYGGQGIKSSVTYEVYGGFSGGLTNKGVLCPRLQTWHDKCRLPASADNPATGCATECGSDPDMRCKSILVRGARAGAGSGAKSASASSASSSSSSSFALAARRSGLSRRAARWQAALAEAAAEDPGILVPDGELFWTEFEREQEREREQQQQAGGGGGEGIGERSTTTPTPSRRARAEPVPAHLRHLAGKPLEAALAERRALRERLTAELEVLAGGGGVGGQQQGASSAAAAASSAEPAATVELPFPWYAQDPCLRHYANATGTERSLLLMFNPTQPAQFRAVVSDYSVSLLSYAMAASRGPSFAG